MKKVLKQFPSELIHWFQKNKRDLPWRKRRTPYRVWISELMLQQTRVDQVIPYYNRFLIKFPSLKALSQASREEVLKCWEGLGYYGRARRMHETARYLMKEKKGLFPRSYEGLIALKGIGPYTAAAIGSLSMKLDLALVDGNVARVLSRLFAYTKPVDTPEGKKQLEVWAAQLLPKGRAGEFNEALMEFGATCCLPRNPRCSHCPFTDRCAGFSEGIPESYPLKNPKKKIPLKDVGAALVLNKKKELLISQRQDHDMLGGLWEFPGGTLEDGERIEECIARELYEELGIHSEIGEHFISIKHNYSHFKMILHVYWAKILSGRPRTKECADYKWVRLKELSNYPFSRADLYVIEALLQTCSNTGKLL